LWRGETEAAEGVVEASKRGIVLGLCHAGGRSHATEGARGVVSVGGGLLRLRARGGGIEGEDGLLEVGA